MRHIAIATDTYYPNLTDSDRLLIEPLFRRGVHVTPAYWNDPTVNWSAYDGVLIRSVWDYHLHPDAFLGWIERLQAQNVRLWNPAPVVRWNMQKRYLKVLAERGIPTIPTVWLDQGASANLPEILATRAWDQTVIKPEVSAGAHQTWRTTRADAERDQAHLEADLASHALMIQPYVEEIALGEWSIFFFQGIFSHSVLKPAVLADDGSPLHWSQRAQAQMPSPSFISQAAHILHVAAQQIGVRVPDILIARVDGVDQLGQLTLMELELIEPDLYFAFDPQAAPERLANAIQWQLDLS